MGNHLNYPSLYKASWAVNKSSHLISAHYQIIHMFCIDADNTILQCKRRHSRITCYRRPMLSFTNSYMRSVLLKLLMTRCNAFELVCIAAASRIAPGFKFGVSWHTIVIMSFSFTARVNNTCSIVYVFAELVPPWLTTICYWND